MYKPYIFILALLLFIMSADTSHAQSFATSSAKNAGEKAMKNAKQAKTMPITTTSKDRMASKSAEKKPRAWLSNAAITAINGTSLTVTKAGKTYAITTSTQTKLRRHYGGEATITEFAVGNFVDIAGQWTDTTQTAIAATSIRNRSIMKLRGTFTGEVVSKTGSSIVLATKSRGNVTVTVSPTTKYVNRSQAAMALTDVLVGHKLRVRGLWDKSNNTVTQVIQVKDFSLPAATVTPKTVTLSATPVPSDSASQSAIAE